jgi:hypothetical protein
VRQEFDCSVRSVSRRIKGYLFLVECCFGVILTHCSLDCMYMSKAYGMQMYYMDVRTSLSLVFQSNVMQLPVWPPITAFSEKQSHVVFLS